jgi:hypothetical protein
VVTTTQKANVLVEIMNIITMEKVDAVIITNITEKADVAITTEKIK